MSWGAGGRAVDEMLHLAAVRDRIASAAHQRAAALVVTGRLGPDCRDVLEALGLATYAGHDVANSGKSVACIRVGSLIDQASTSGRPGPRRTTCWRCGGPKSVRSENRAGNTGLCADCYHTERHAPAAGSA